tara:strand:+ start:45 stop:677 length:633 start_codon:yes stop_codon:yes gene_type:complete
MPNGSAYPGYEVPQGTLIDYLNIMREPFGLALGELTAKVPWEDRRINTQDIIDKLTAEKLKMYFNTERVEQGSGSDGAGGFYTMGTEPSVADTIFLKEPAIGEDYWSMLDAVYNPMSAFGYMSHKPGLAETVPHELFHTYIPGKSHVGHGEVLGSTQGEFRKAIQDYILPETTGQESGTIMYPKTGEEASPSWDILRDMFYGYKNWKLTQ